MFDKELTCINYNNQWDITTSLTNNSANIPPSLTGHTVIKQHKRQSEVIQLQNEMHRLIYVIIFSIPDLGDSSLTDKLKLRVHLLASPWAFNHFSQYNTMAKR